MSEPELISIETFDGNVLNLGSGDVRFLVSGGFALPDMDYVTFRGYQQHGESVIAPVARERTVTARLWRAPVCSREDYWNARNDLLDFFNFHRGGPMTLIVRLPGGDLRAIDVRAEPGPVFPTVAPNDDTWHIEETLQFVAFDPVWYDPRPVEYLTGSRLTASQLVFPITFPITFGVSGAAFDTGAISYAGTWDGWAWIKLTGPYTWARLTNTGTGAELLLFVPLAAGDVRYLDLRDRVFITDVYGNSCFDELGPDSDLIDFNLKPVPLSSGQHITAVLNGGTALSGFEFQYYARYIGI